MSLWKKLLAFLRRAFASPVPSDDAPPPPGPPPDNPTPPPDAVGADALDLSNVVWLGTPVPKGTPITARITSASIAGDKLYTRYEPYSWPSDGKAPKPCDAVCHLFYQPFGLKVIGGKFDWWSNGGQPTKGLENVITGYHGHAMPTRGMKVWTMISSVDGKQRSNTVKVEWR